MRLVARACLWVRLCSLRQTALFQLAACMCALIYLSLPDKRAFCGQKICVIKKIYIMI